MANDNILNPFDGTEGYYTLNPDCPTQDYLSKTPVNFLNARYWVWTISPTRTPSEEIEKLRMFLDEKQKTVDILWSPEIHFNKCLSDRYDEEDAALKKSVEQSEARAPLPDRIITNLLNLRKKIPEDRFQVWDDLARTAEPRIALRLKCHDCGYRSQTEGFQGEILAENKLSLELWWEQLPFHFDSDRHMMAKDSKMIKANKSIARTSSLHRRLAILDDMVKEKRYTPWGYSHSVTLVA
ncbi:uncharacterized protein LY89DRAFT_67158 [Mollisia scopiformis]|uniref:Uncharacterized protein n=1 Tax=Mollisia scopiformis TaxID=149040 RepID=A0A194X9Q6_MOLSC|nr:uncharacterized protein LY89DRAFT_67158 [Mollisia scopiformis]KUJ16898.1 hypothetical protein LY89DRAFT_67158 [Mollisia scopiformis]